MVRLSPGELQAEIQSVRSDVSAEIALLRSDLRAEIASLRSDLGAKISALDRKLRVLCWMTGTTLAGVAALLGTAIAIALHIMRLG